MTDSLRLKFIIVGASTEGLCSAIALKNAGHHVIVLEKVKKVDFGGPEYHPEQLPPNGFKVLSDWGLGAQIKEKAVVGDGFKVYKYQGNTSGRDCLGTHLWPPELLEDARGSFLQMRVRDFLLWLSVDESKRVVQHKDLLLILYNALEQTQEANTSDTAGAVFFDSDVVQVDFGRIGVDDVQFSGGNSVPSGPKRPCYVTLRSGKIYTADVIIGADGASGIVRQRLFAEEEINGVGGEPTGLAIYSAVVPRETAIQDKELASLYKDSQKNMVTFWMGPNRGAQAFLAGKEQDVVFWVYTTDNLKDDTWCEATKKKITDVVGTCDPLIERLAALAGPATCVQIKNHRELESWVSQSGTAIVLGEAAHPFPTMSLHSYSIAIEDGAFIGKVFSRMNDPQRIGEFLSAFDERRRARCVSILQSEHQYINVMSLPDGPLQIERDALMRANEAAGRNILDAAATDLQQIWEDMRQVFGYDPSDDAEEWWMSWGRLHEAAVAHSNAVNPP
ncbi:hypothetical protein C8R43DRAFT_1210140 [Mycena crocata]|nr:hypothetical protein C8R43DRAFT_1210140 [Mycena crocata]